MNRNFVILVLVSVLSTLISCKDETVEPIIQDSAETFISLDNIDSLKKIYSIDNPNETTQIIRFTPDNKYFVSTFFGGSGELIFRDTESGEQVKTISTNNELRSYSFSADGTKLVVGDNSGKTSCYDIEGNHLFSTQLEENINQTIFSPDGKFIATGGFNGHIQIIDVQQQSILSTLFDEHTYVSHLVFSPNGKLLIAAYERPSNVMKIWDTETWEVDTTFSHVTSRIDYHDLVFTPDGKFLSAATSLNEIVLFDCETWKIIKEFQGHTRGSYEVEFSTDGKMMISGADDYSIIFWDVAGSTSQHSINTGHEVTSVEISPNGQYLAFGILNKGIDIWTISE